MFEPFQPDIKKEALTTYEQIMLEGYEKGIEKGIEKGMKKGELKGKQKTQDQMIIKAFQEGLKESMIAKIVEMTMAELQERMKHLGLLEDK